MTNLQEQLKIELRQISASHLRAYLNVEDIDILCSLILSKQREAAEKALEHGRGWQMYDDKWIEFKQQHLSQYDQNK